MVPTEGETVLVASFGSVPIGSENLGVADDCSREDLTDSWWTSAAAVIAMTATATKTTVDLLTPPRYA
jgi:hypothetical protein